VKKCNKCGEPKEQVDHLSTCIECGKAACPDCGVGWFESDKGKDVCPGCFNEEKHNSKSDLVFTPDEMFVIKQVAEDGMTETEAVIALACLNGDNPWIAVAELHLRNAIVKALYWIRKHLLALTA